MFIVIEIAAWNLDGLKNQDVKAEISNSRPDSVEIKSGKWDLMERKTKLASRKRTVKFPIYPMNFAVDLPSTAKVS